MSPDQMRKEIVKVYYTKTWKWKVEQMSDNQVIAIYMKFLEEKKL